MFWIGKVSSKVNIGRIDILSIKKNYAYNTLNQILRILISIVSIPYISRVLGATNIGIYSYTYTIASYFILFIILGLDNYGNREIAKVKNNKILLNQVFNAINYRTNCCFYILYLFDFFF